MGAIYPAVVKDIRDYGLIVELAPGVALLLHKSQISHKFVSHLTINTSLNFVYTHSVYLHRHSKFCIVDCTITCTCMCNMYMSTLAHLK